MIKIYEKIEKWFKISIRTYPKQVKCAAFIGGISSSLPLPSNTWKGQVVFWSLAWLLAFLFILCPLREEKEPSQYCNRRSGEWILAAHWLWDFGQATHLTPQLQILPSCWIPCDPAVHTGWIIEEKTSPAHKITLSAETAVSKSTDKSLGVMECSCWYNEHREKLENLE